LELTDPILDQEKINGTISQLLRQLDDKLKANNATALSLDENATEVKRPLYPLAALKQLIGNALMHRTYSESNAPVRIYWFSDRIEIHSPGGPNGQVTAENFGQPGLTDYRNPLIAEALKVLGFVQKFGMGISLAQRALEQNGNPKASFRIEPTYVLAVIRSAP